MTPQDNVPYSPERKSSHRYSPEWARLDLSASIMFGAVLIGAALRTWQLSSPSLSHVEIYIPGIDLIAGLSAPPPRHGFVETLVWQFYREPHPAGYYMAMWAWTAVAGTSEFALRLPSVLIGTASIWFTWRLGRAVFDRKTAAIAALLLSLDGFHVYWSQIARMYVPGTALALLSTWALVTWTRAGERRPWLEVGYAAALIAGTQCDELFWAVPFLHLAWVTIVLPADKNERWQDLLLPWSGSAARIVQIQAIAIALASPEFVHAAQLAYDTAAPAPTLSFLIEYFNFGFLFQSDDTVWPETHLPLLWSLFLDGLGLLLALSALKMRGGTIAPYLPKPLFSRWLALAVVIGATVGLILALVGAGRRRDVLPIFAVLPVLCLWLPGLSAGVGFLTSSFEPLRRWLNQINPFSLLLLMLAVLPPLLFFVGSLKMSVLAPRAFLLFTPFFILLVAAALQRMIRVPFGWVGLVSTIMLFIVSLAYFHGRPHSRRDYKVIAKLIARERRPKDIILVRLRNWADTPMYYYLHNANYIPQDPSEYFRDHHPQEYGSHCGWRPKTSFRQMIGLGSFWRTATR